MPLWRRLFPKRESPGGLAPSRPSVPASSAPKKHPAAPGRLSQRARTPAAKPQAGVAGKTASWPVHPHPAFSEEALRRAWRAVRANGGGAGIDGVDIAAFEAQLESELAALAHELTDGAYLPRGVRRILIPKRNDGLRPLAIWTLRDRVAQRAVYAVLEPQFESGFLPCSHGFRPGRSVQTAVADVVAGRDKGLRWVVDADIKDCFDNIAPDLLMTMVRQKIKDPTLLRALESWLRAGILTATGAIRPAGTAQGGVLSPLLCNVYLHGFDVEITGQGLWLVRYADDLVVLCRRRQEAQAAQQSVEAALKRLRLQVNPYKTRLASFDDGFKFLGVFFLRNEQFSLT